MKKVTDGRRVVLCEDHVYFGGMQLTYQLSLLPHELQNQYYVAVLLAGERCEADAGCDLERAIWQYRRIREGCVTPCGLDDVMQELHYA